MRVAIVAALLAVASLSAIIACGEETTATPDGSDGGGGTDTGSSGSQASGDGGDRAPTGCLLKSTGYTVGTKAENAPRTDVPNGAEWSGVEGALTEDGNFATVTLNDGQESAALRVSGFGFQLPASAETWGIEVELKRRAPDGGVDDARIDIEIEGKATRFKVLKDIPTGSWPTSIVGTHAYGQAVDTWGIDLLPSDVNKASFAAKVAVKRATNAVGPVTAVVESIRVAVHYCPEPNKK